ncbi:MAG: hypothetical protein QOF51_3594 [Chloroflexota bacterium]|jgi:hypothetical protein|nr:hypothetical protein [Chloroflexota bacterium]
MADTQRLRRAAEQARMDPFFLAGALLPLVTREGLDDASLAAQLGCTPADLPLVLLCRRPDRASATFRADVERIATRFGLDALVLVELLNRASAYAIVAAADAEDTGLWLVAARDREPPEGEPAPDDGPEDEP